MYKKKSITQLLTGASKCTSVAESDMPIINSGLILKVAEMRTHLHTLICV